MSKRNWQNRENEKELHTSRRQGFQRNDMVRTCDALYYI